MNYPYIEAACDGNSLEKTVGGDMVQLADMTDEERFAWIEHKVEEARRMLLGVLLLAKNAWKDELTGTEEGIELMGAIEEAEESFVQGQQPDRLKRLEHNIDVINHRAKSMLDLMSYISTYEGHT